MSTLSERFSRQICSSGAKSLPYSGIAAKPRCGVFDNISTVDEIKAFTRKLISSVFESEDKFNEANFCCNSRDTPIAFAVYLTEEQAEAISKSSDVLLRKEFTSQVALFSSPPSNSMMSNHDSGSGAVPMDVDE